MSGGSWSYLYSRVRGDPLAPELMRAAALRLGELGDKAAAAEAERCATLLEAAWLAFERLHDALHGMEWVDSGDWAAETFRKEMSKWQGKLEPLDSDVSLVRLRQLTQELQDAAIAVAATAVKS